MEILGPIKYVRPSPDIWENLSLEQREHYLLLETVDDIRKSVKTISTILIIFMLLVLFGGCGVVIFPF